MQHSYEVNLTITSSIKWKPNAYAFFWIRSCAFGFHWFFIRFSLQLGSYNPISYITRKNKI